MLQSCGGYLLYSADDMEGYRQLELEHCEEQETNKTDTHNHDTDEAIYRISHAILRFWWVVDEYV